MTRPTCLSCWHYWPAGPDEGFCRRYPPATFVEGERIRSAFPPVRAEHGCGEHRPNDSEGSRWVEQPYIAKPPRPA
jgi:hypothetical protein